MKPIPRTSEFDTFIAAVRDILKVTPQEMKTRIEVHKESGKRLSKGASLAPAAAAKIRSATSD